MARPNRAKETEGCLGPATALLHPLPPTPGVPAVLSGEVFQVVPLPSPPRPGPGESCALPLRSCWTHAGTRDPAGPALGRGARHRFSEEAQQPRRPFRSLALAGSRACKQPAAAGEWEESERAGGGRRLEAGVGGGEGGGAGGGPRVGGRCAWREDRPAAACPPRGPPPWRSYPFSSWPPRHGRPEIRVWGLRDSGKDVCRSGRMAALVSSTKGKEYPAKIAE
ncbi:uncharacterized protein LOC131486298 [Neofelis nebulosa]|uniref:uncharacterized protein LOC131486298 n=1 Tax=Neofelis nebulosa TaxID=61452 RepID=UPI00272DC754|nr:uncharacterized protein LOC131486298 [Neofelis nebulosa]